MNPTKETGKLGENYTVEYLLKNGYIIKERNFYAKCGEIDIIAQKGGVIAFVEVKSRRKNPFGRPCDAVTKAKQIKILKTAAQYIAFTKTALQPRFDVAEVIIDTQVFKPVSIHYIKHAFWQEEDYAAF